MNINKTPKTRREHEVWEACDELWQELPDEGLSISDLTGERIKGKLVDLGYKRGNPGQIYQYRNSWQLSRGIEENEDLVREERSAFLSDKVQKAVELLFKEIQVEAEEKINRSKNELEAKLKEFSNKNEIVKKEHEVLCNKLEATSQSLNALKQINLGLTAQLNKEKHEHEIIKERLSGAEAKYDQLATDSKKTEQLFNERNEKDKRDAQTKINDLIAAHKKDMSELKEQNENQRHRYLVETENLKVANSKLDKQLEKITLLEQKTNNTNDELKQRIKNLEKELALVCSERSDLTQKLHNTEKVVAENKGEIKQLQILLNHQKEDYQNTNKQLLDYKERVGRLEEQLQQAKVELTKKKASDKNNEKSNILR